MKVAIDSNVLLYAEGIDDLARELTAGRVLRPRRTHTFVIPLQCLGEVFRTLLHKAKWSPEAALLAVRAWQAGYQIVETTQAAFDEALVLATKY